MKFIHAADLHIDSPLRGLDQYEGAPVERIRGASRQALIGLVNLALDEDVAFVVLSGDIFDSDWVEFRTGLFFREQMVRLARRDVRVFIVKGNHDAESSISKQLPEVEGVKVFSSLKSETVLLERLGVALHGRSFPNRVVTEDLVPLYPAPVDGYFNIGVLHTSLSGREGHDTYAPTSHEVLTNKGYDYFALGHVHAREVVQESNPRIVYPGNLQGRHAKETGSKGCELVTVQGGLVTSAEHVSLEVVRWHQTTINVTNITSVTGLAREFVAQVRLMIPDARERLHAIRVHVTGESALHRIEAQQPGSLAAAVHAAAQDVDGIDIWIEEVKLGLRSAFDRVGAAAQSDAVGEVVRLVDSLRDNEGALASWFAEHLAEMKDMPNALVDAAPASLDGASMLNYLADAEAAVLAQLAALGSAEPN
jgi:exonuclease SbcD